MTKPVCAPSGNWDRRIARARELAGRYPFAAEILTFYSELTTFQQTFYSRLQSTLGATAAGAQSGQLSPELSPREVEVLLPQFRPFLAFLRRDGTSALAEFAGGLEKIAPREWAQLLTRFWRRNERDRNDAHEADEGPAGPGGSETSLGSSAESLGRFTALAFLQPYAEYLATRANLSPPPGRRPVCPFCRSKPLAGVLRPEGDGGKRSLVCSFCYTEWDYVRIACPACEERDEKKLCVYSTPAFDCVRVEGCETCHVYIKTVDLTKNGRAIPEVDELAAIPLTLWADEQGYIKLSRNILGC